MKKNKKLKKFIPQKLLSTKEVADMFRVDETTITKYAREGGIPCFKVGRLWRFPQKELIKYFS